MRICTGAWKSCFLPPSAPALCCRQLHGPWGSRGWDFLGLPVFPGPTRLICVQPQDCRILVRPLHTWPICMSCSRGFFSCPGELWPLFLTISLLASVPWPACPSRAGYPCVSQSACGSLSSPLPPVPLPDTQSPSAPNTCFIVQRWFSKNTCMCLTAANCSAAQALSLRTCAEPGARRNIVGKARVRCRGE